MSFICRLVTLTYPFVWGWYGVDNLWLMEYFLIRASKTLLQKCDPLSLIIALGVLKWEKIFFLRNLTTTLLSLVFVGTRHNLQQPRWASCRMNLGMVPWSRYPKHQKFQFKESGSGASCLFSKNFQSSDNLHMTCKSGMSLWTKWASKTHFVKLFQQFCGDRSVLRMQVHGKNRARSFVLLLVYIVE